MATRPSADELLQKAKAEAKEILVACARGEQTITYLDLTGGIKAMKLRPYDRRLSRLISEISREEDEAGRGMLSVLVVRGDTHRPGARFFTLAEEECGRVTSNREAFWQREKAQVFAAWSGVRSPP